MTQLGFNVRVYGLWVNEQQEVLVCDEERGAHRFTKFPGGGLELGEGTRAALWRECKEEMQLDMLVDEHLYTTDFYQASRFDGSQVISIYYCMHHPDPSALKVATEPFAFTHFTRSEKLAFRWVKLEHFDESLLTFPIDKVALQHLKTRIL